MTDPTPIRPGVAVTAPVQQSTTVKGLLVHIDGSSDVSARNTQQGRVQLALGFQTDVVLDRPAALAVHQALTEALFEAGA